MWGKGSSLRLKVFELSGCECYLSCNIGAYNKCKHLCKYCNAKAKPAVVISQSRLHDTKSPFFIENYEENHKINDVFQQSWVDGQMRLF